MKRYLEYRFTQMQFRSEIIWNAMRALLWDGPTWAGNAHRDHVWIDWLAKEGIVWW